MSRRVVVTRSAQRDLVEQIEYLIEADALPAARRLKQRFDSFLGETLAVYPGIGTEIPEADLFEVWIPKTRLVVWYQFDEDTLTILRVWHSSRDRHAGHGRR